HGRELQKGATRVQQTVDALARQQLAAGSVLGAGRFAASLCDGGQMPAQVLDLFLHGSRIDGKVFRTWVDARFQNRHEHWLLIVVFGIVSSFERNSGMGARAWRSKPPG